jgi:hypothetical protein
LCGIRQEFAMIQIDEWTPLFPKIGEAPKAPPPVDISTQLEAMKSRPPVAVHFYLGEGLRWIRVGFSGDEPLEPSAVVDVGRIIESCIDKGPLFFHALRPYDMLFFLEGEGEDKKKMGMPAVCYGAPLSEVLRSWGAKPPQKAQSRPARAPAEQTAVARKRKRASAQLR